MCCVVEYQRWPMKYETSLLCLTMMVGETFRERWQPYFFMANQKDDMTQFLFPLKRQGRECVYKQLNRIIGLDFKRACVCLSRIRNGGKSFVQFLQKSSCIDCAYDSIKELCFVQCCNIMNEKILKADKFDRSLRLWWHESALSSDCVSPTKKICTEYSWEHRRKGPYCWNKNNSTRTTIRCLSKSGTWKLFYQRAILAFLHKIREPTLQRTKKLVSYSSKLVAYIPVKAIKRQKSGTFKSIDGAQTETNETDTQIKQ